MATGPNTFNGIDLTKYPTFSDGRRKSLDEMTLEELALNLGLNGEQFNWNPKDPSTLTTEYKRYYDKLSPDLLLSRYSQGIAGGLAEDQAGLLEYNSIKQALGRDPTASEYSQFAPFFQGPQGSITGRAAVAKYADEQKNTPQALQSRAGSHSGEINAIFQDLTKRGATQDEINHFGALIESGQVDPFTIRQFVDQLPEVQQRKDQEFRQGLNSELGQYDTEAFNRGKDDIIADYMRRGLGQSSSLDTALTSLLGDITKQRGQYLAQLSASQYGGNKDAARADYQNSLNTYLDDRNYGRQRNDQYMDTLLNRGFQGADYMQQKNDYMEALSRLPSQGRPSRIGSLIGGLAGAGIGGFLSKNPQGASAGYQIGSGLGGGYDYYNY